eukprot:TRINITY_DN21643_c0_g1_i1.p1 TRINITY_DN21643_c0_g1~~TRINITY_DN21643_c0_g1_i1.p1  ORF type:complete len:278 (+),score=42.23 TRINITY_DN21643_c0_g1_i1:3-836(+)
MEARMMQLLGNHPHVVRFIGACLEPQLCIVSAFVGHGSLEDLLEKSGKQLQWSTKFQMARQVASGLYHLHCEGVIHRDIAARNVLVGENHHMFVTDFGFSRTKNLETNYDTTKTTFGPVKWMAPECLSKRQYSKKSDSFAFAVLMWEITHNGEMPYSDESQLVTLAMEIVGGKRLKAEVGDGGCECAEWFALMKQCWETDPEVRPGFDQITARLGQICSMSTTFSSASPIVEFLTKLKLESLIDTFTSEDVEMKDLKNFTEDDFSALASNSARGAGF